MMRFYPLVLLILTSPLAAKPICQPFAKKGEVQVPAAAARFRQDLVLSDLPKFCRIVETVKPRPKSAIGIELWLPEKKTWNGRYLQIGNAGFAGTIQHQMLAHYLRLGYAVASTDNGHQAYDDDTRWSLGQPEKIMDFGYRAVHETSVFAQRALAEHYGRPARFRYMAGCSDGGREGLMEAQRYPKDFDGVLAGAAAQRWTHGFAALLHAAQVLETLPERLTAEDIQKISRAVRAQCDAQDGLDDGIVDPAFDCQPRLDGILSAAKLAAVQAIRNGPAGVHGFRYTLGYEDGPFQWPTWFTGPTMWGAPEPIGPGLAKAFFATLVYQNPTLKLTDLSLDAAIKQADQDWAATLNATNPKLSPKGPKILQYHGWADAAVPAQHALDYHAAVRRHDPKADAYHRLFMVPGMGHCLTGAGPHIFNGVDNQGAPRDRDHDALLALQSWVEEGRAPDRIIATQFHADKAEQGVWRTRPVCPYPQRAQWDGKSSPLLESAFHCCCR